MRRRPPVVDEHDRVAPELFWGMFPGAFDPSPDVQRRTGESGEQARERWRRQVRAAGWTVARLRAVAAEDERFQNALAFVERKRRVCAMDQ